MRHVVIILALIGSTATAKGAKNEVHYITSSGQEVAVTDALLSSLKGETVYKCTQVESKVSKSGTSIALKARKK